MFSNNQKQLLNNINKLPNELVSLIESYVPQVVKIFWNKSLYESSHTLLQQYLSIHNKNVEEYVNICISELKNNYNEIKKIQNKYRIFFAEQNKHYCVLNNSYLIYLYTNVLCVSISIQ